MFIGKQKAEELIFPLYDFIGRLKNDEVIEDENGRLVLAKKGKIGSNDPSDYYDALSCISNTSSLIYFLSYFHFTDAQKERLLKLINDLEETFTKKIENSLPIRLHALILAERFCEISTAIVAKSTMNQFITAQNIHKKYMDCEMDEEEAKRLMKQASKNRSLVLSVIGGAF